MGKSPPEPLPALKSKRDSAKNLSTGSLSTLLQSTGLWRAASIDSCTGTGTGTTAGHTPSGFADLDRELPGGGWPSAGLSECLHDLQGIGEFRLLMPGLARLSHQQNRWLLLVSPPYIPYPPALRQAGIDLKRIVITTPSNARDYLWVMEKALASQSCSAVIAWPDQHLRVNSKSLRRLQVASKTGDCWGILFRPTRQAGNPSPAELRLLVEPAGRVRDNSAINVRILKRRGAWESGVIRLHFDDELQRPMPDFSEMLVSPFRPSADAPQSEPDVAASREQAWQ